MLCSGMQLPSAPRGDTLPRAKHTTGSAGWRRTSDDVPQALAEGDAVDLDQRPAETVCRPFRRREALHGHPVAQPTGVHLPDAYPRCAEERFRTLLNAGCCPLSARTGLACAIQRCGHEYLPSQPHLCIRQAVL